MKVDRQTMVAALRAATEQYSLAFMAISQAVGADKKIAQDFRKKADECGTIAHALESGFDLTVSD